MRKYGRPRKDAGMTIIVTLIVLLLLKILFVPNPIDVIVLGGLIFILIFMNQC